MIHRPIPGAVSRVQHRFSRRPTAQDIHVVARAQYSVVHFLLLARPARQRFAPEADALSLYISELCSWLKLRVIFARTLRLSQDFPGPTSVQTSLLAGGYCNASETTRRV